MEARPGPLCQPAQRRSLADDLRKHGDAGKRPGRRKLAAGVRPRDAATSNGKRRARREFVSYATPCVLKRDGQPEELIFLSGAHGVSGDRSQDRQDQLGARRVRQADLRVAGAGRWPDPGQLRIGRGRQLRGRGPARLGRRRDSRRPKRGESLTPPRTSPRSSPRVTWPSCGATKGW